MASTAFMTEIAGAQVTNGSGAVTAVGADLATVPHHPGDIVVSDQGTWHVLETITDADNFVIAPQWSPATGTATLRIVKVSPLHTADGLPGNVQLLLDEVRKKIAVGGLISGAGDPADNVGQDGEYYLNMTNPVFWGPKAGGTWAGTKGTPLFLYPALQGPPGEQGIQGVPGMDGADVTAILSRVDSRAGELVENSLGSLGNNTNFSGYGFDGSNTPNLSGTFYHAGYFTNLVYVDGLVGIDPNRIYSVSVYLCQDSVAGDWSAFSYEERHRQYVGMVPFDVDGLSIESKHHMRYRHTGIDSLTTLTAPLTPGDTTISLNNASGWNESSSFYYHRGLIIFGYKNSLGALYDYYSRIQQDDMFELVGVDKGTNTITLNKALPAALGNPDDPNGTWPAGTRIANSSSGAAYKYIPAAGDTLAATNTWYRLVDWIGGVDTSGTNSGRNFPPGCVKVKLFMLPNYTLRAGGYSSFPDTGPNHKIRMGGLSVEVDKTAKHIENADGTKTLYTVQGDPLTGSVSMSAAAKITEVV